MRTALGALLVIDVLVGSVALRAEIAQSSSRPTAWQSHLVGASLRTSLPTVGDVVVFADALAEGWANWSWNTNADFRRSGGQDGKGLRDACAMTRRGACVLLAYLVAALLLAGWISRRCELVYFHEYGQECFPMPARWSRR